jgi:4-hydroxy-tetrahydrodipicolinate synthase
MNLENIKARIKGPVYSIVTPFLHDDSIDFKSLEKYVELIYNCGGRIFYVMGYNSRYSELSWEEIKILNAFVIHKAKSLSSENIVIVADPLHCPTTVSAEVAQQAEKAGADIISIICREKYYSDEQIYSHFKYIADRTNIGILVHEMPFLNGYGGPAINYSIELLDQLADIPNVIALKEDAKDDEFSAKVIARVKDRVSIIISGGGKRQWLRFADQGCQSWLNGIGVFNPRLAATFYQRYLDNDVDGYMDIVNKIEVPFFEKGVKKHSWHLTIKAALEAQGIMSRHERLPMLALSDKKAKEIADLIKSLPIEEVLNNN